MFLVVKIYLNSILSVCVPLARGVVRSLLSRLLAENNEQRVAGLGTLPLIGIMMGRDEHHPRSQILGCKILASLAMDPPVRHVIGVRPRFDDLPVPPPRIPTQPSFDFPGFNFCIF